MVTQRGTTEVGGLQRLLKTDGVILDMTLRGFYEPQNQSATKHAARTGNISCDVLKWSWFVKGNTQRTLWPLRFRAALLLCGRLNPWPG